MGQLKEAEGMGQGRWPKKGRSRKEHTEAESPNRQHMQSERRKRNAKNRGKDQPGSPIGQTEAEGREKARAGISRPSPSWGWAPASQTPPDAHHGLPSSNGQGFYCPQHQATFVDAHGAGRTSAGPSGTALARCTILRGCDSSTCLAQPS